MLFSRATQHNTESNKKQSVKFKENEEIGRRITRSMKSSASDLLKEEETLTTKEEETLGLKDNDGLTPIEEGDEEESAEASNADDKAMNGTDKNETLLDNELIKTVRDAKFIVKNCLSLLEKENIQPKSQVTSNATGSSSENDKETAVTVVSDLKMQSSADETQKVKETSTNKTNAIVNGTNQDSDEEVDVCSNSIDRTIKIDESEIKQEKEEEIKQEQKEEMKPKKEEEMKPKKEEEMKQEKEETPRVEKLNSKKDIINFKINMLLSEISIPSGSEEDEEKRHPLLDSMAEEGEEDTPSEGSNDIVEIGEEINTTESEFSSDESYDKNSFIDDEENCQLLSGEEYDLSLEDSHKRRRIIKLSSGSDDEVVRISKPKKKIPKKRKKSRIIRIQDSSDEDEDRHDLVIDVEEQQIKQDCEERSKNETEGDNDDITMETITVQTRGEGDQKVNLDVLVPCDKKPEEDNTFNEKVETFDRVSASSGTFEDEKPEENNTFHGNVEERGCISSPFVDPKNKIEQENILPSEDVVFGNVEQVSSLSTRVDNNKVENKETVNYKDAEDSEQNPFVEIVDNSIATGDDSWKDRHLNEKIIILENIRGQSQSGPGGGDKKEEKDKKKKYEPPIPTRVGKKKRRTKGPDTALKLPVVTPHTRCRLKLLKLERIKDYLLMEEEFIRNQERLKPQEEKNEEERSKVDDLRGTPMSVGNLEEIIDDNHAIVSTSVGSEHYVSILSFVDKDQLEPGCSVLLNHKVHAVVGVLGDDTDPMVTVMKLEKAPQETYADIGGLDTQIQEIKESVELPLTHPEYYEEMGIKPPKGVILYGPPGTGKTLLAKAVANQTSATFLRVVGSELIQKYLGDGPKLVRELFRVAEEHAPSIVFIDEIDAVGTKRYDSNSGGEREIQRTMLELLNQLDGFDSRGDVKVIMATNRIETLDPALIRPGRIDRKIEFPLPDEKTKKRIFNIHTSRMTLAEDVNLQELIMAKDDLSGADIKAICTEAGLMALRERRMKVMNEDFKKSKESVLYRKKEGTPEGLYL
ncbi:hypothetical protein GEV33_003840 [Tenebrio molitor]|uniref:AAA+ ATPase domain-containing protein n=1 Tax=Tenebrio molitor TaxID=7067 RepID=A0A8J6HS31_TENMO|nr:hypothetical protein GEV33_003840 [Tenebrio molitor]